MPLGIGTTLSSGGGSAFYAGLAVSLAGELDKAEAGKAGGQSHQAEVLKRLVEYCKSNCDYFRGA